MADLNVAVAIVGQDAASAPISKVVNSLQTLTKTANDSVGILGRFGSMLTSIAQQAASFAAGFILFDVIQKGFDAAGNAAIGFNARMEQTTIAFKTMLGSAQDAQAFLFQLQKFAAVTPFDTQNVVQATQLLLGMGFAAKDIIPILTDLGNVAAALGMDSTGIEHLALVLGQMHTTGHIMQQDLNQLSQAGVNVGDVFQQLSLDTGKSVAALKDMQQQGKLNADLFITAFREWSQAKFGDAMEAQSHTFSGAMSTIRDSLTIVASTAFRPLFDRISELAQNIANFVSGDAFSAWGAKVAAVVDVVLSSLGTLANAFFESLSSILSVTLDFGKAIYEALSWINPFATHSPSLVSQVNDGVDAIVKKYQDLGLIAQPIMAAGQAIQQLGADTSKTAVDNLKEAVSALKDRADLLTGALSAAKSRLNDLVNTPIQGEGAFSDKAFAIQQQINAKQLQLTNLELSRGPEIGRSQLEKQIQLLELQKQQVDLQSHLQFDPQHRAIQAAANPQQELPFQKILQGVKDAQKDIDTLKPASEAATNIYKAQEQYLQQVQQAATKAAAAIGDVGKAPAGGVGDLSFLDKAKQQLADWNTQFAAARQQVIEQAKPFTDAINNIAAGMERFASVLERIHSQGLAGGITELLFPTEGPANSTDALMNQMGGVVNGIQHPTLGLDQIGTELGRRIGEAFSQAVENIDWAAIGQKISTKMTVTFSGINWEVVLAQAAMGMNLTNAFLKEIGDQDFTPVGKMFADKLVGLFGQPIVVPNANIVLNAVQVAFPMQAMMINISNSLGAALAQLVEGFFGELAKFGWQTVVEPLLKSIDMNIIQPIKDTLSGQKISESGMGMIDGLTKSGQDQVKKRQPDFFQMARDIIQGLADGLSDDSNLQPLVQAVNDLAQHGTVDPFLKAINAHSPSQVFFQFGQWIDQGLAAGITSQFDQVASAALSMGQVIRDALQSGIGTLDLKISMAVQNGAATIGSTSTATPAAQHSPHARIGALAGATGLNFIVGGHGGVDSQFVPMLLTPGEHVVTTPPGQGAHGRTLTITAPLIGQIVVRSDADLEAIKKQIAQLPDLINAMFEDDARSALGQGSYSPVGIQVSY